MVILLFIVVVICLIILSFCIKTRIRKAKKAAHQHQLDSSWFENDPTKILTPKAHQRSGDQSFLTYPEWFLVFSPAEQASYFKTKTSTTFPYEQHVEQFWDSYAALSSEIKTYFPYNNQYHTMIKVIGYSTLIEYRGKLLYEQTIGRLTALIPSKMTAEDQFYGAFMQRYVDFIKKEPWYRYSFTKEFKNFWLQTSCLEWNWVRKLERRIFISIELLFKAFYGWILGLGTQSTYGVATPTTVVVVDALPDNIQSLIPELTCLEVFSKEATLISLPRYAAFNPAVVKLIKAGVQIKEIAGNTTSILLTVVVDKNWQTPSTICKVIFRQAIATQPDQQRIALAVRIQHLSTIILQLEQTGVSVEHIFDY